MIAENAADFSARFMTVTEFEGRVAFGLGGHGTDPGLTAIPLPAAWLNFSSDVVDEAPFGHSQARPGMVPEVELVLASFTAAIYLPYVDEADLIATQYPLLEACIKAVKANQGQSPGGFRWRYVGQKLALLYPDRLAYEQHYTLNWPM